jgi:tetratricopeptide (TPR) repeat protein
VHLRTNYGTPREIWDPETGKPDELSQTAEMERVCEKALLDPESSKHIGIVHKYIHIEEGSPHPEKAITAGDILFNLMPDAAHVSHMPSHLDILMGDYRRAIASNVIAIKADNKYIGDNPHLAGQFYGVFRLHNYHTLAYAAALGGHSKIAFEYTDMAEKTILNTQEVLQYFGPIYAEMALGVKIHLLVRFGRWEEILAMKVPEDQAKFPTWTAQHYYGYGVAHSALGHIAEAEEAREKYREALAKVEPSSYMFPNKAHDILAIATSLLDGELEYRKQNYEAAFGHLRKAVEAYDSLIYSEPSPWEHPPRHALAALLLEQGHVEEALKAYGEDLGYDDSIRRSSHHPNNVWALHGYHECLVRLGRIIEPQLKIALAVADIKIESSCFCRLDVSRTSGSKVIDVVTIPAANGTNGHQSEASTAGQAENLLDRNGNHALGGIDSTQVDLNAHTKEKCCH